MHMRESDILQTVCDSILTTYTDLMDSKFIHIHSALDSFLSCHQSWSQSIPENAEFKEEPSMAQLCWIHPDKLLFFLKNSNVCRLRTQRGMDQVYQAIQFFADAGISTWWFLTFFSFFSFLPFATLFSPFVLASYFLSPCVFKIGINMFTFWNISQSRHVWGRSVWTSQQSQTSQQQRQHLALDISRQEFWPFANGWACHPSRSQGGEGMR